MEDVHPNNILVATEEADRSFSHFLQQRFVYFQEAYYVDLSAFHSHQYGKKTALLPFPGRAVIDFHAASTSGLGPWLKLDLTPNRRSHRSECLMWKRVSSAAKPTSACALTLLAMILIHTDRCALVTCGSRRNVGR